MTFNLQCTIFQIFVTFEVIVCCVSIDLATTGLTCFYGWSKVASYDFGRTYASRKQARCLLDMHTNHHDFLARSENVRCSCALPVK